MGSDSKNGVRHQRALSSRLSMMMITIGEAKADPSSLMTTPAVNSSSNCLSTCFHISLFSLYGRQRTGLASGYVENWHFNKLHSDISVAEYAKMF